MSNDNPVDRKACIYNDHCHYATPNPFKRKCPVCGRRLVTIFKRVVYLKH